MTKTKKNAHIGSSFRDDLEARLRREPAFAKAFADAADRAEIARQVKAARERRGFTQSRLAKEIGTSQSVVAQIESGTSLAKLDMLSRIGDALGVRVRVVFEDAQA